jgi:hypothetical protein
MFVENIVVLNIYTLARLLYNLVQKHPRDFHLLNSKNTLLEFDYQQSN